MERVVRGLVASMVLASLGALVLAGVELAGVVGGPFSGFVFLANGDLGPRLLTLPGAGPAVAALRPQDRVVAVDGVATRSGPEVRARIAATTPGTPVRYTILRSGKDRFDVVIPVVELTWRDAAGLFGPFAIGGILLIALTGLVAALQPLNPAALVFFTMGTAMGTTFGVLMVDSLLAYRLGPEIGLAGLAVLKASVFHLALLWPERRSPLTRWPRLLPTALYAAMLLQALVFRIAYFDAPRLTTVLAHVSVATLVAGIALLGANIARSAWSPTPGPTRRAARTVLAGPVLGLGVGALLFVNTWVSTDWSLPPLLFLLPIWVTLGGIGLALMRDDLFAIDTVARRMMVLGIQGLAAVVAYLATLLIAERLAGGDATGWTAATVFAIALLVAIPAAAPLRKRAEAAAAALFPRQRRAAEVIHRASRELARVRDEHELARRLREAIGEATRASSVRVLVGRRGEALTECGAEGSDAPEPGPAIAAAVALGAIADLADAETPVPRALAAALEKLGVALLVPLPAEHGIAGAFLLGAKSDGRPYNADDRRLLETLAAQSAVALENARAWQEVRALEQRLSRENHYLREQLELSHGFEDVVGRSESIRAALAQIERVAPTDATVLVIGETGTGKELAIRSLHALSRRRDAILVKVACAAIPESLIESELFGHEKGSFTGATQAKPGRFEVADGGTLFFDDVDTLPLGVQAKLLRAIQEGEVQRVGSNAVRHVDVRIVAATNKDLLAEVRAGRFREDLYYRLHVVPIRLPPLRERAEDIAPLVQHFVEREGPRLGRRITAVAAETMAELEGYSWPGNIRELRNVIERALVMSSGDVLRLPGPLRAAAAPIAAPASGGRGGEVGTLPLAELVRRQKIEWIRAALAKSGGNQRLAAEMLGLHRPSLTRMIRELGIREGGEAAAGSTPSDDSRPVLGASARGSASE
jgi:transcriptional regulator with GAF, ATPase, and Fis domain